jgi:hypothetical protein
MKYWESFKAQVNWSVVVSTMVGVGLMGVGAFGLKKLRIKPVTEAVNVATKGAKK